MDIHHLGYACTDIEKAIKYIKSLYDVKNVSEIIFDELQNAHLCLIEINSCNYRIELVCGEPVKEFLGKGISLYHVCYEVDDLFKSIESYKSNGAIQISEPRPAKLFDGRLVVFLQTELGLTELLAKDHELSDQEQTIQNVSTSYKKKLVIAANYAIQLTDLAINYLLRTVRLNFEVHIAPYNQLFQLLLDPQSVFRTNHAGVNLLLLKLEDWLHYETLDSDIDFYHVLKEAADDLLNALKEVGNLSNSIYLIHLCPPSPNILSDKKKKKFLYQMEAKLVANTKDMPGVYCIASKEIFNNYDYLIENYYDLYTNQLGHIPYTPECEIALAISAVRKIRSIVCPPHKVIVVDCDQTLWDGVCGEVGAIGVKFTPAHQALQKFLVQLYRSGFLICICSKNNKDDVLSVFNTRTDMALKKEHITDWCVNWNAKSGNIRELSNKLNLSLDSFIFIDDDPVECAEVIEKCPDVLVLELPKDKREVLSFIKNIWAFDKAKISQYDEARSELYRENAKRQEAKKSSSSLQDFIAKLNLKINFSTLSNDSIERVAELSQRTNQFNTTTIRRTVSEIRQLMDKEFECIVIDASDRFGDYGLIGAVIFFVLNDALIVESFMLSCRALGRNIEHKVVSKIGHIASEKNIDVIKFLFEESTKNQPALNFFRMPVFSLEKYKTGACFSITSEHAINIEANQVTDLITERKNSVPVYDHEQESVNQGLITIANQIKQPKDLLAALNIVRKVLMRKTENYVAPSNELEQLLVNIWENTLSVNPIGILDDFFALGGSSLLAIRLASIIRQKIGVELTLKDIFDNGTVLKLSNLISHREKNYFNRLLSLEQTTNQTRFVQASYGQQRLWFLCQLEATGYNYNMPVAFIMIGNLDVKSLKLAFSALIRRHEILRTRFENKDGVPYQIILDENNLSFEIENVSGLHDEDIYEIAQREARQKFDINKGPLFRVRLLDCGKEKYILLITKHHIVFDGWSYDVMYNELSQLYNAYRNNQPNPLLPLPIQYKDFTLRQQQWLKSFDCNEQLNYWTKQLDKLTILKFPTAGSGSIQEIYGKYIPFKLPQNTYVRLAQLAATNRVSHFTVLLLVFGILISRYCGQTDIAIGVPVSGRQYGDVQSLIGFFVNTVVIRLNLENSSNFLECLSSAKRVITEAQANQDIPFEKVVEALKIKRDLTRNPLFQILFSYQEIQIDKPFFEDVKVEHYYRGYNAARVDVTFEVINFGNYVEGGIYYNKDLFTQESMTSFADSFCTLLNQVCLNPKGNIFDFPLLGVNEQKKLISKWTKASFKFVNASVLDKFDQQVLRFPESTALQYQDNKLTYRELDSLTNQLAHYLLKLSVKPLARKIAAIALERSLELIIAIIGCLKAGFAYVPLDPNYPDERLNFIL